jgi:hypothetical protein
MSDVAEAEMNGALDALDAVARIIYNNGSWFATTTAYDDMYLALSRLSDLAREKYCKLCDEESKP